MNQLDQLQNLALHDCTVEDLQINFAQQTITIIVDNGKGQLVTMMFKNFENLSFDGDSEVNELEIYSANFKMNDDETAAEFLFLLGFGLPSLTLRFKFTDCDIATSPVSV